MSISEKYGRTHHYPFSPGATGDDKINYDYWNDIQTIPALIHTEKLDGENNCLSKYGVFARSHAAPATSAWTASLREYWQGIKNDLGDLEVFLENCCAIHSLQYRLLEHHFYVFAVREKDIWLSWEETKFYAAMLDLPVVPEIEVLKTPANRIDFEQAVHKIVSTRGAFEPLDIITGEPATMEGIVSRNTGSYPKEAFSHNVFKYVRKGHVKTDEHWTRTWKRAPLKGEGGKHVETI